MKNFTAYVDRVITWPDGTISLITICGGPVFESRSWEALMLDFDEWVEEQAAKAPRETILVYACMVLFLLFMVAVGVIL